jgi:hypothetical protein
MWLVSKAKKVLFGKPLLHDEASAQHPQMHVSDGNLRASFYVAASRLGCLGLSLDKECSTTGLVSPHLCVST